MQMLLYYLYSLDNLYGKNFLHNDLPTLEIIYVIGNVIICNSRVIGMIYF